MTIKILPISDWAIEEWDDSLALPPGEIGEIVVKGPVVTRLYLNRPYQTVMAKIKERDEIWHRMGDIGYFDDLGRLWFCGRKSHRVETEHGLMLPIPCEAVFNQHQDVARTALVGVGKRGQQRPVLVVEPMPGFTPKPDNMAGHRLTKQLLELGAKHEHTRLIKDFLFHPSFPVDVRHNAKIQREKLAAWVIKRLP
jgi:acyl-CoA synthetase (AMP-forming)/AMP-acid ligase II